MKNVLGTTCVAASLLAGGATLAQSVEVVDLDRDGVANAYLDNRTGLLWSNGSTFSANTFAGASTAVGNSVLEGITSWRIPTQSEFLSLYQSQLISAGNVNGTTLPRSPFTLNANFYWTTNVFDSTGTTTRYVVFDPNHSPTNQNSNYFSTTNVGVWAVSSVPEPGALALFSAGLFAFAVVGRKRSA